MAVLGARPNPVQMDSVAMQDDVVYVSSHAFKIDEVHYSIGVYRSDAGFMAFCDCHKWPNENMKTASMADKESAVKECEELIRQHHTQRHPIAA